MLDIWRYAPTGKEDVYLCHEKCESWVQYVVGRADGPRRLVDELKEVVEVLAKEGDRIITLIFESRLGGANPAGLVTKAIEDSEAAKYVFYADRKNERGANSWEVEKEGWPTRRWMIDNGFRLVVFSDRASEMWSGPWPACRPRDNDGLPYLWSYAVETEYGNNSMNPDLQPISRQCSPPLNHRLTLPNGEQRWPLLVMNYFPTFATGSFIPALFNVHNSYSKLSTKTDQVTKAAGRSPNFIAIDYFELGYDDGPLRVLQEANRNWSKQWKAPTGDLTQ